jgi:hypothetical protein
MKLSEFPGSKVDEKIQYALSKFFGQHPYENYPDPRPESWEPMYNKHKTERKFLYAPTRWGGVDVLIDKDATMIIQIKDGPTDRIFYDIRGTEAMENPSMAAAVNSIMSPSLPKGKYLFYLQKTDTVMGKNWRVYINPAKVWKNEHVLADHYSSKDRRIIEAALNALDFIEESESMYCYSGEVKDFTQTQLTKKFLEAGFAQDGAFDAFMRSFEH